MSGWTWLDIAQLWMAALAASLLIVALQMVVFYRRAVAKGTKFFWLLPYSGTVAGVLALTRAVAKRAPLIAVALYVILSLALVVTLYWMAGR